ncbi:WD repeat domain-containing protein [Tetrabaena socialis]|uniref:WD repeat domain-containing protein n=1 Tax=Tetrabaena socialis TaxID=47790 RepID=A0A2J7ZVN8_9CHLO|nr:WD repeat domain-containing protein [Tetrabaena socialis]|eukprot:PNH04325.1 WD repeat domain-containing protein [Tetrabaena socialis]
MELLKALSVRSQEQLLQRSFVPEAIATVASSPDGSFLAAGGVSGTLHLWELASGCLLHSWAAHYKSTTALLFVDGASLLISGSEDTLVNVWLLPEVLDPTLQASRPAFAPSTPLHTWSDHTLSVTALAAGAGGAAAVVASASLDQTIKLHRLSDGQLLRSVALPAAIHDLAIDAGEQLMFAACGDGVIYEVPLMPIATPNDFAHHEPGHSCYGALQGHSRPVTCVALASLSTSGSAFADVLVSGSEDGTVRVWDLQSRQPIQVLQASDKTAVTSVCVVRSSHRGDGAGAPTAKNGASASSSASSSGPWRLQPLAPLSKYAEMNGAQHSWRDPPIVVDGSVQFSSIVSGAL